MKRTLLIVGMLAVVVFLQRVAHHMEVSKTPHKVLFVIRTTGTIFLDANLTYINSSGGSEQEHFNGQDHFNSQDQSFPKEYEMEVTKASGDPVYISAQLNNEFE